MVSTSRPGKFVFGSFVFVLIVAQVADENEYEQQHYAENHWQLEADDRCDDQGQRNRHAENHDAAEQRQPCDSLIHGHLLRLGRTKHAKNSL